MLLSKYVSSICYVPGAAGVLGDKAVNGRTGVGGETLKMNVSIMSWVVLRKISRLRETECEDGMGAPSDQEQGSPRAENGKSEGVSHVDIQGTSIQAEGKAGAQSHEATATWCVARRGVSKR